MKWTSHKSESSLVIFVLCRRNAPLIPMLLCGRCFKCCFHNEGSRFRGFSSNVLGSLHSLGPSCVSLCERAGRTFICSSWKSASLSCDTCPRIKSVFEIEVAASLHSSPRSRVESLELRMDPCGPCTSTFLQQIGLNFKWSVQLCDVVGAGGPAGGS